MKKLTAVEWLSKRTFIPLHELEQAKQIEKDQLIEAYSVGYDIRDNMGSLLTNPTGEQYYNETYKIEKL